MTAEPRAPEEKDEPTAAVDTLPSTAPDDDRDPPPLPPVDASEGELVGEGERVPRTLTGVWAIIAAVVSLLFALYQIGHGVGWIDLDTPIQHRAVHVWFGLVLTFLWYAAWKSRRGHRPTILDAVLIVAISASCVWIIPEAPQILTTGGAFAPEAAVWFGLVLILVAVEASRRVLGWAMPILAGVMVAYALWGNYIPGQFGIRGFTFENVMNDLFYSDRGLFGSMTGLSAGVIAAFLLFGAVLYQTGGGETFVKIARLATGSARGGPAKVSTVSSALFGIASGSAVANVIVDGVFNIPLMRKAGYSKKFAAAVEAVASSGGQIVPPFMGAAAFVMAEFIGVPYATVALAAIIPALLYYAALYAAIHLHAIKHNLQGIPRRQLPRFREMLPDVLKLLAPMGLLIWLLVIGFSPETSVLYSMFVTIAIHLVSGAVNRRLGEHALQIVKGLIDGGKSVAVLAVLILAASIVVREIDLTALGVKLSASITDIAESSRGAALIVAMLTTVVLGMGLPTTAAYVIAAAVVVPAIVESGVDPLPANMFVLYFAVMSAITPPVAPAVFAAASLARTSWVAVGWEAGRLSLPAYLVPFLFVLSPSLVLVGSAGDTAYRLVISMIGLVALSAALIGYLFGPLGPWRRVILVVAGLLVIFPALWADIAGLAIVAAVVAYTKLHKPVGVAS